MKKLSLQLATGDKTRYAEPDGETIREATVLGVDGRTLVLERDDGELVSVTSTDRGWELAHGC